MNRGMIHEWIFVSPDSRGVDVFGATKLVELSRSGQTSAHALTDSEELAGIIEAIPNIAELVEAAASVKTDGEHHELQTELEAMQELAVAVKNAAGLR